MTKPTKYTARYDGKVVGTRKSPRTYVAAIVIQYSEEKARAKAYDYQVTQSDHDSFAYYCSVAATKGVMIESQAGWSDIRSNTDAGQYVGRFPSGQMYVSGHSAETIARAKAFVIDGKDGYFAQLKAAAIARFESAKASGYYEPTVITWCGRPDLAAKEANKYRAAGTFLAIVPAETN